MSRSKQIRPTLLPVATADTARKPNYLRARFREYRLKLREKEAASNVQPMKKGKA